jgi:hypothetical protein
MLRQLQPLHQGQASEIETPLYTLRQLEPLRRSQAAEVETPAYILRQLEPLRRSQASEIKIPDTWPTPGSRDDKTTTLVP